MESSESDEDVKNMWDKSADSEGLQVEFETNQHKVEIEQRGHDPVAGPSKNQPVDQNSGNAVAVPNEQKKM